MTLPARIPTVPEPLAMVGVSQTTLTKQEKFAADLRAAMPNLLAVLPHGVRGDTLAAMALTVTLDNPTLLDCEPLSLVRATLKVGLMGLRLSDTADIVQTKKNNRQIAECWIRVKGVVELSIRSGAVQWAKPDMVVHGDTFEFEERTSGTHFVHAAKGTPTADGSNVTHFYAIITLRNGHRIIEVWNKDRVCQHRDRFAKNKSPTGTWATHFCAMAMKTVVKAALRYAPLSPELMASFRAGDDEIADTDFEVMNDPTTALQSMAKLDALVADADADADGAVRDASDGLTFAEACTILLPGKPTAWGGHGGKQLADAVTVLPAVIRWIDEDRARKVKFARLHAASVMLLAQRGDNADDA